MYSDEWLAHLTSGLWAEITLSSFMWGFDLETILSVLLIHYFVDCHKHCH